MTTKGLMLLLLGAGTGVGAGALATRSSTGAIVGGGLGLLAGWWYASYTGSLSTAPQMVSGAGQPVYMGDQVLNQPGGVQTPDQIHNQMLTWHGNLTAP